MAILMKFIVLLGNGSKLLSGSADLQLKVWDSITGHLLQTLSRNEFEIRYCAWSRDESSKRKTKRWAGRLSLIKNFQLSPKDVSDYWKIFQKYFQIPIFYQDSSKPCFFRLDKQKTGLVPLNSIFKRMEMERTVYTDCLLELLEIEHGKNSSFIRIRSSKLRYRGRNKLF